MYPAPETKQAENEVDQDQVYCTNASIAVVGRAIAVDLGDAMLPGDEKNKHMTIFFRKGGKWSDEEIALLSSETAAWITKRFGLNAPVTFTIAPWGPSSCLVKGDLESLCVHLRTKFAAMSPEQEQRKPHVALFKAKRGGNGGRGGGRGKDKDAKEKTCRICGEAGHFMKSCPKKGSGPDKDSKAKTCRICGEVGHFKKDCPMKGDDKKDRKERKHQRKEDKRERKEHRKHDGHHDEQVKDKQATKAMKVQEKLQLLISRVQQVKQFKMQEAQLLDEQEAQFHALLSRADELDAKTINGEIKSIALAFKLKRKEMKGPKKGGKGRRGLFGGKGRKFKHGKGRKENKKERKEKKRAPKKEDKKEKKADKEEQRALKQQRKMEKKAEREEKKRLKQEKKMKLESARMDTLPSKADIGGNDKLVVYVDGYNIIGCDSLCRKNMRGRGGGMKRSRTRIMNLLQQQFVNRLASGALKVDYGVVVHLWFDGNGKDEKIGDIQVTFSTKKQIVDDKLVEMLSKNAKKENANVLVVTSDRELTLRLNDIGVKVMKSGTFYKSFLKGDDKEPLNNNNGNNDDDEKETVDTQEDEFVMKMAKKLNQSAGGDDTDNDDDEAETPGADGHENTDDGEETPDEVEGGNVTDDDGTDGDYSEGGDNDDDEDYDEEYTAIFGEDFAPDSEQ